MNDSSTGGYLTPAASPAPLEGQSFEDFMQQVFVGISGLPANMVRPRWQPAPPNIPDFGTDWMALGITDMRPETFAYVKHDPTGNGSDELQRNEEVDFLTSFYGPNCMANASLLRDGFSIAQNREVLQLNGMGLVETGGLTRVPTLEKERWLDRIDMTVTIRRQVLRTYPILNLSSATIILNAEVVTETINV